MNGARKDYDFGQKNNWRRTVWNQIESRVRSRGMLPRDAVVLYLAGANDYDREVAKRHGFRDNNLIAIERSNGPAKQLRDSGVNTINADVFEVLWNYSGPKVNVLILDLCCGIFEGLGNHLFWTQIKKEFWGAVVVVNLMRGRDDTSLLGYARSFGTKHRGLALLGQFLGRLFPLEIIKQDSQEDQAMMNKYLEQAMHPSTSSYKSGNLVFDTLFVNFLEEGLEGLDESQNYKSLLRIKDETKNVDVVRKIAAAKAIRTMRLAG